MRRHTHSFWMLTGALVVAVIAARPACAALPPGWTDIDVGNPDPAGSASEASGVWTVMGAGGDIEGSSDQFNFVYQKVKGDATITAHFLSMVPGDETWTKIGPMIRADDTDGAQNGTLNMTSAVGVRLQGRDDDFPSTHSSIPPCLSLTQPEPVWLRLERVGKNVMGFYSVDGNIWSWAGATLPLGTLKEEALFGLAVTSHQDGTLATAKFDNVSVQPGAALVYGLKSCSGSQGVTLSWQPLPGAEGYNVYRGPAGETDLSRYVKVNAQTLTATSFADTSGLVTNQPYTYLVTPVSKGADGQPVEGGRAAIQAGAYVPLAPPGFTVTSINEDPNKEIDFAGGCVPPLGAFYDATTGTITVRGSGGDGLGGNADTFNFTSTEVQGDFQVSVKALNRPTRTSSATKAGLMIRDGLTAGAREAHLVLTASQKGLLFEWRTAQDAAADAAANPLIEPADLIPPLWIRLTRRGEKITAEYSLDGSTWKGGTDANNQVTLAGLPSKVNVGLAITSDQLQLERQIAEATFQNLTITPQ
jgi:regulation of enolase protein 1 (concanavalin A-like superfamily)